MRVADIAGAVEFYTQKLGFQIGFTWGEPLEIAGVNLGEVQLFLERGTPSPTLEGVGPHTKADLRQIQELERKHGIHYDSHPSYRFVEAVDKGTGDV